MNQNLMIADLEKRKTTQHYGPTKRVFKEHLEVI